VSRHSGSTERGAGARVEEEHEVASPCEEQGTGEPVTNVLCDSRDQQYADAPVVVCNRVLSRKPRAGKESR